MELLVRLSTRRDLREKTKKESDKTLQRGEGVVGKARGLGEQPHSE